ncbi:MAG TPA: glycosyltransferase family 25 protein [Acidobacteriota bacterium]|nr:glycosyltransferase family 25 protein [Acidobacteriota bacterium]HNJ44035.1 glycosyltransferase family 25 protein [Acidobacteriota bacterium]
MNNQLPPIWVISLQRSTDRRAHITQHLTSHNLAFEICDAVDGQQLTASDLALYDARQSIQCLGREMTHGEIGCALSHLRLQQRMVNENIEEVLILEDDAVLKFGFFEVLQRRALFPSDWELMLLCNTNGICSAWYHQPLFEHLAVVKFAGSVHSNAAYLLKQSGARKLLAAGYPIRVPSDNLTGGVIRTQVRVYGISPVCVTTLHPFDLSQSTMPETRQFRPRNRAKLGNLGWFRLTLRRLGRWMRHQYYRYNPLSIV